jgi:hypothetical protein
MMMMMMMMMTMKKMTTTTMVVAVVMTLLCRDGIPSHLRGDVWQALLGRLCSALFATDLVLHNGSRLKALESAMVGRTYQWCVVPVLLLLVVVALCCCWWWCCCWCW